MKQNLKVKPDASYVNYGGLRASLPQGKITVERIFELMPFENEIVMEEGFYSQDVLVDIKANALNLKIN